jgi:hypothetical protein
MRDLQMAKANVSRLLGYDEKALNQEKNGHDKKPR